MISKNILGNTSFGSSEILLENGYTPPADILKEQFVIVPFRISFYFFYFSGYNRTYINGVMRQYDLEHAIACGQMCLIDVKTSSDSSCL
jgi:hypothetical protein